MTKIKFHYTHSETNCDVDISGPFIARLELDSIMTETRSTSRGETLDLKSLAKYGAVCYKEAKKGGKTEEKETKKKGKEERKCDGRKDVRMKISTDMITWR